MPVPPHAAASDPARSPAGGRGWWLVGVVLAVGVAAAQLRWFGRSYWNFSDGVYLETADLLRGGADLYTATAVAQPPLLLLAGAGILAVEPTLTAVRVVLALVSLVTAGLGATAAWRLTRDRRLAALAGVGVLVTPWFVREHLALTPETLAAPLLMGAALLVTTRRGAVAGGVLAALAVGLKLSFLLPAVAVLAVAPRAARGRAAAAAAGVLVAGTIAASVVWAPGALVRNLLTAQREVGLQLSALPGYAAQAAWNLAPLVLLAGAGLLDLRRRAVAPALLRTWTVLALASLVLLATLLKRGSYLNVIAQMEPVLVVLAVAGLAVLWRRGTAWRAVGAALVLVTLVQTASLVVAPDHPRLFARPFSALAGERLLSTGEVDAAVAAARRCPAGSAFSGPPFVAFAAHRPMPGDQPDLFIVAAAPDALRAYAPPPSQPRCP